MASNDILLLDQILRERQAKIAPELGEDDYFELFVVGEILKNYDLSYEETDGGITFGGNDWGIDAIYTFIDGLLVTADSDFSNAREGATVELIVIQAKRSPTFRERLVNTLISTASDLLDMENAFGNKDLVFAYSRSSYRTPLSLGGQSRSKCVILIKIASHKLFFVTICPQIEWGASSSCDFVLENRFFTS